jgi:hypothetical protein
MSVVDEVDEVDGELGGFEVWICEFDDLDDCVVFVWLMVEFVVELVLVSVYFDVVYFVCVVDDFVCCAGMLVLFGACVESDDVEGVLFVFEGYLSFVQWLFFNIYDVYVLLLVCGVGFGLVMVEVFVEIVYEYGYVKIMFEVVVMNIVVIWFYC